MADRSDRANINQVLELVGRYAGPDATGVIQTAYDLVAEHKDLPVRTIDYGIAAAEVLARVLARPESVAAALLVELPEERCPPLLIQQRVGDTVAQLVAGVQRMRNFPYLDSRNKPGWSNRERFELYHAFVASLDDPQWVLIELAHQLTRLRRLGDFFPTEQRRIASEALDIYAPLAHRMGIWHIKWELEDGAFQLINPAQFQAIVDSLDERRESREEGVKAAVAELEDQLAKNGIRARITGRPKHIYSIYRKMQRKGVPFEGIYDVRAIRVIIGENHKSDGQEDRNIETCYLVLGLVHDLWQPIPGQFDDYIAKPKNNGYRSLHTAVIGNDGQTIEVQIRTDRMDREAESGIAAHWRYKELNKSQQVSRRKKDQEVERAIEARIATLRALLDVSEAQEDESQRADTADIEQPVFVFSPMGDVIRLPAGATPIDFAYRIHTELGNRCQGAKVNGRIVPLNHRLATGERVEIITKKRGGPNLAWLSLERGFIKTQEARKKIGAWFRRQTREKNIARGHELLDRELAKLGLKSSLPFDDVAHLLKFKHTDDMLAQIGAGEVTLEKLRSAISGEQKLTKEERARQAEEELITEIDEAQTLIERDDAEQAVAKPGLLIASTQGLHSRLAKCCYPVPPEKIVGYVTRGYGATIHRADCPNISANPDSDRIVPAQWGENANQGYPAMVIVEADNRRGLMGDLGATVAKEKTDISEAKGKKRSHGAVFELLLEVQDAAQLARVIQKLEQTKGVRRAYRKKG